MHPKLDEFDLKILNILSENSRASISDMAKALRISRPTAKQRIENMEKNGIIKKYTIDISEEIFEKKNEFLLIIKCKDNGILNNGKFSKVYKISEYMYAVFFSMSNTENIKSFFEDTPFEIVTMYPILEKTERKVIPKISVKFHCDYCGKEVFDEPVIFKLHNKVYFFCCKTCLREFKKSIGK